MREMGKAGRVKEEEDAPVMTFFGSGAGGAAPRFPAAAPLAPTCRLAAGTLEANDGAGRGCSTRGRLSGEGSPPGPLSLIRGSPPPRRPYLPPPNMKPPRPRSRVLLTTIDSLGGG